MPELVTLVDQVFEALRQRPGAYLVGVAGIPGSGKSTLSQAIVSRRPEAMIVAMDGYHLPRSQLDADGLLRRGAPDTFDREGFQRAIAELRQTHAGWFPTFDHAEKDPRPNSIQVTPAVPLVIVEGLYVLMRSWQSEHCFDLRVFIDVNVDVATERLAVRHAAAGLARTVEEGRRRATTFDRHNALAILADGCRERADLVLRA